METQKKNKKNHSYHLKRRTVKTFQYLFSVMMALSMAFPFYWMIVTAMKTPQELSIFPPKLLPESFNVENFIEVLSTGPFLTYMKNSVSYALLETALTLLIAILAAYGFYISKSKFKKTIMLLLMLVNVIPFEVVMIFNYKSIIEWNLYDSLWALILPFVCNFTYVFIIYNAFEDIPRSLYYSAKIDKTSNLKFLLKIAVPYVRSTIVFVGLMNVVGAWNSFIWPLLVTTTETTRTLPIGIYSFIPENGSKTELVMAMSVLSQLPMTLLFLCFQKYMRKGIW